MTESERTMEEADINKNRWTILSILVMVTFMATLDSSIVNVALPVMAEKLNVTSGQIAWVVSAYLITIVATILIFGRLGDIKGRIKVYTFGLVLFTIGSLLCGVTHSLAFLIGARIVQAVGAAGVMANSQGIVTQVFPPHERGRALGITGSFVALGTLVGPSLGGFIISVARWEALFWINVPIGIVIFFLSLRLLPKNEKTMEEKLDIPGALLFVFAMVPLFAALGRGQALGFNHPVILTGFLVSLVSFSVFLLVESKVQKPLLHMQIFKNKWFSISIFCAFISFIALSCSNIILPFYLQDVLTLSPGTAGLFMTVYPLVLTLVSPVSGYLSDKIGSEILTCIGLVLTSISLVLMSTLNEHPSFIMMGLFIAIMSLGNGLFQSPNNSLVMSTVPKDKLGIGGSVNALVRNLGMVCGIALATTLLYGGMSSKIGYRVTGYVEGRNDAFIFGMRIVYITAAVICMVGALVTAFRLYGRKTDNKRADDARIGNKQ